MKIYTKVVMKIDTLETVEEESYEYEGEVAQCGGSSGGGSGSGEVDYPEYMKQIHGQWLAGGDYEVPSTMTDLASGNDLTTILNNSLDDSPYTIHSAYDPEGEIASMRNAVTSAETTTDTMISNKESSVASVLSSYESYINSLDTTDKIETELASFDAQMRSVNAVGSSSFIIAKNIIASSLIETKLTAMQNLTQFKVDQDMKFASLRFDKELKFSSLRADIERMALVAFKEQTDKDIKIDKQDALWNFEIYQMASNIVASIAGGTVSSGAEGPSELQSAIGGGLAGAAAGASVGGPPGAVIGGALGAGAAYL